MPYTDLLVTCTTLTCKLVIIAYSGIKEKRRFDFKNVKAFYHQTPLLNLTIYIGKQ